MPLFISDDELSRLSNDAVTVAEKADAYIRELSGELETAKAKADAAAITAEQTCSLLEQKFLSISGEISDLQSQNAQLQSSSDDRLADLAEAQAQKHQLHLQAIGKDGEIERLTTEVSELHKSKRQLLDMIEMKDLEIADKNATVKAYLDKIVNLTDNAAHKESRVSEIEAELVRVQATCTRLSQEKELIERHNAWLNEELTAKVDKLIEIRRTMAELEADMSAKLADIEKQYNECSSSLNWHKERTKELESKLTWLQEELCSSKEVATSTEERFSAELSIANRLVELYKERSEESSKKAGELEGAIKALEMHLGQVQDDYKERLEKEASAKKQVEKEIADLKEELEKCKAEIEAGSKANDLNLLTLGNFTTETCINSYGVNNMAEDNLALIPKIPIGVSGTALAASLLRDGWSLAKIYAKYQEAVDALRHEQLGRKESESILQRVLREIEEKAVVIMDERAEHESMLEAYAVINQKLQNFTSERSNLEKTIQELKADLRRHERDNSLAQKEIADLQKQVTVLLKECRDIQLRCGPLGYEYPGDHATVAAAADMNLEPNADKVISELTFKDINGLVEQNVQLRSLVRDLSGQIESQEMEFKEKLELELKKQTDEAASKVATVLQRAEEQGCMIESLHTSVAMYKKLYEEEHKRHLSFSPAAEAVPDTGRRDLVLLLEGSQEASKKAQEKATERLRCLEEDLAKARGEIVYLRSERDKLALEANFAKEKVESIMKEADRERDKINGVLARNVEFSQLIVDYQKKLRESSESLNAAEERSRKFTMEVSILKQEKKMLTNAEKRACDEVRSLSERVYRLQASLDTIQSAEEVREETRALERRKQEEYVKQIEKEWAEAKKQVQEERDNVRTLISDREQTLKNAMKQVEEIGKELANALRACASAEARASVSEARLADLEKKLKSSDAKILAVDGGSPSTISTNEAAELPMAKEEIEKLKEEAKVNRDHMLQYKNIAQANEAALKQIELAHENFKIESEKLKNSLEAERVSLRERVFELENESSLKSVEAASATAGKEEALSSALAEITNLKEETAAKSSQIMMLEIQISSMKENLEKEHEKWRTAQANYERQVILQSETIQELTKTSQELALLQGEASELRKLADAHRSENAELKAKWETEKSILEESRNEAEKKYGELNEQNKILHSQVEAMHIQFAEKDRGSILVTGSSVPDSHGDSGLQNVVSYLRRTKEIAETEMSLLKQEKLRLQSQLENALKAEENVKATLNAERASSRAVLMTEDEIKSLQHQIREMNLLRESNMQLREENKHNFEECQKLREVAHKSKIESEALESQLMERKFELEASKREIEKHQAERDILEKRVSELLERCRNIDVEDYDRLKNDVQQKEEMLKVKDAQIEDITNLLSKKQDIILKLEQDLANSKLELNEKEKKLNDILQSEGNLKSDMEKQKRLVLQFKRRAELLAKEKEQMSKDNHALSKEVEELKQGRRSGSDITGDQVMKEKEEKDTRIQILEKTVERQREELKKEKDEHQNEKAKRIKCERTIMEAVRKSEKGKATVVSELEKYQLALKRISEELEKLKHAEGNLPQGTSVVQLLSGSISDDHASPYLSAAEDFERVARSILNELGTGSVSGDVPSVDNSAPISTGTSVPDQGPVIASSTVPVKSHHHPAKASEERRRSILPKTSTETRKTGRKLVRPRFPKLEERQSDVEMSESTSHDVGAQGTLTPQNQQSARKRLASSTPDLSEDLPVPGETSTDVVVPALKKSKGSDSGQGAADDQAAVPSENLGCPQVTEEADDTVGDATQGSIEEVDVEKEETETMEENFEDSKEPQVDGTDEVGLKENKNVSEEISDKPSGNEMVADEDESKSPAEQDSQQPLLETESEREEGELLPEVAADTEGGTDVHNAVGISEVGEVPSELVSSPLASPSRVDEEAVEGDNSPDTVNDEKNEEGYIGEEETVGEGFEKSNDGNEQSAVETDPMPEVTTAAVDTSGTIESGATSGPPEGEISKNTGSSSGAAATEAEDVKQMSPASGSGSSTASTVVNLHERARERAMLRQAGVYGSSTTSGRGRGRVAVRARGARGRSVRGGRSGGPPQNSDQK